jgi:uncharacterized integral membrane protein
VFSKKRSDSADSPEPGVIVETTTHPVGDGSLAVTDDAGVSAPASAVGYGDGETRGERFRRRAHRSRLHAYAALTVVLVVFLIALAVSNTAHVKVSWVFGTSHVSLVWLVLFAAILGWLLGLLVTAVFHWRTRAPKRHRDGRP